MQYRPFHFMGIFIFGLLYMSRRIFQNIKMAKAFTLEKSQKYFLFMAYRPVYSFVNDI